MQVFHLQWPFNSGSVEFQWNFSEISGTAPVIWDFGLRGEVSKVDFKVKLRRVGRERKNEDSRTLQLLVVIFSGIVRLEVFEY
jgi:hypothetical protein